MSFVRQLSREVLPEPISPIMQTNCPFLTWRPIYFNMRKSFNDFKVLSVSFFPIETGW